MRALPFYLLIALSVVFLSCSKEDETPIDETLLIGDWNVRSIQYTGTTTTNILGMSVTTKSTGTGIDMDLIVSFTENPKTFVSSGNYSVELVTEAMGQTSTDIIQVPEFMIPGSWSITNGNKLQIVSGGENQEATINKLSASEMVMTVQKTEEESYDGVSATVNITSVFTFTKN